MKFYKNWGVSMRLKIFLFDIHSDIENYGRLSGPYTKRGNNNELGWELLYIDSDSTNQCN
jgi:hypothetical protein